MSLEYLAQMGPMLVTAALAVAWLAEVSFSRAGYGLLVDIAVGVVGSVVAGLLVGATTGAPAGMVAMFVVGGVGAAAAIATQRGAWHPA